MRPKSSAALVGGLVLLVVLILVGLRPAPTTNVPLTDSDGSFTITGLSAGSYVVDAVKVGHAFESHFMNPITVGLFKLTGDSTVSTYQFFRARWQPD